MISASIRSRSAVWTSSDASSRYKSAVDDVDADSDVIVQVAGGADYDTGSNATGYKSSGNIKAKALEAYSQKAWMAQ